MPILFNCPDCNAPIRVADAAAGKKGRCPRCGTDLIVPRVGPTPPAVATGDAVGSATGDVPTVGSAGFPVIDPGQAAGPTSVARAMRQRRRRQRRKGMNWLWPVMFFALILGVTAFLIWKSNPPLEGQLSAVRLPDFEIPPQPVDRALVDLPADKVTAILDGLKAKSIPQSNTRNWMTLHFKPTERGLSVHVDAVLTTEVFRVTPLANGNLQSYVREEMDALSAIRQDALRRGATAFFRSLARSQQTGQPFETSSWRYELAVPAQTGAFGHVVEAVTDERPYPCIYEDDQGRLYFLLPRDTKWFILRGRELPDGSKPFTGRYVVRVEDDTPAPAPSPDATAPDEATDTDTNTDSTPADPETM